MFNLKRTTQIEPGRLLIDDVPNNLFHSCPCCLSLCPSFQSLCTLNVNTNIRSLEHTFCFTLGYACLF